MSTTLSKGFKMPVNGDKGASLFADLEFNIQRTNDHTHDGSNSAKLPTSSLNPTSQTVAAANWVLWQNGIYRQTIATTGSLDFTKHGMTFRDSTGKMYELEVEKITASSYYVYSNDNTLEVSVIYN